MPKSRLQNGRQTKRRHNGGHIPLKYNHSLFYKTRRGGEKNGNNYFPISSALLYCMRNTDASRIEPCPQKELTTFEPLARIKKGGVSVCVYLPGRTYLFCD